MAVYLLNLGFSMAPQFLQTGSFKPYNATDPGMAQSCAWFVANTNVSSGWQDQIAPVPTFNTSNWTQLQSGSSDSLPLSVNGGDYLCVRIFQVDPPGSAPVATNLRPTLVFGNGPANARSGQNSSNLRQSPLQLSGNARSVVDFDNAPGSAYPSPCTTENGAASATTWVYCLGKAHSQPTDSVFTVNTGATGVNLASSAVGAFGHDPIIKVKGGT